MWPEGLWHYVAHHNVKPEPAFIARAQQQLPQLQASQVHAYVMLEATHADASYTMFVQRRWQRTLSLRSAVSSTI
jgi:hypothetical protein